MSLNGSRSIRSHGLARAATWTLMVAMALAASAIAAPPAPASATQPPAAKVSAGAERAPDHPTIQTGLRPWKGDFDGMKKRRIVRALVPYSKTFYYVEKGQSRGISYDVFKAFEDDLNKNLKTKTLKVHVIFLPVGRDELISKLNEGYGDVVFADLTITPERQKLVDFSAPLYRGIQEVVVTAPGVPPVSDVAQLSGQDVFVRPSSSYHEHLLELNTRLAAAGKPPVRIRDVSEDLETEDVLEMVNAGLIPRTVVDRYKAIMWVRVFKAMRFDNAAILHDNGENAFMLRKDSPQLKAVLDDFVASHAQGTMFGNSVVNRYVKNPQFVKSALGDDERRRFGDVLELFRKYGDQYDMDYLLMLAQGFQESGLNQSARSHVGAIGIMQVMPATGRDLKVGDIQQVDNNVNAGVKYMRFMLDQYFAKEPMTRLNKELFAFAAYNAGPGRVASLRREAANRGLDPNRWFNNVELVAADKIGPETVTYVSNIYKYYTAYQLLEEQGSERHKAIEELQNKR